MQLAVDAGVCYRRSAGLLYLIKGAATYNMIYGADPALASRRRSGYIAAHEALLGAVGMPSYSLYPRARLMFCRHCVAAPLRRLSMVPTTTTLS